MFQLQKKYIHSNKDIDAYFIKFEEQSEEIIVKDNIISIKGKEFPMNIINKTIIALDYLINIEKKIYDYVIRTNISTVINIKNLIEYLNSVPINNFYSGIYMFLTWLDYKYGINEENIEKYNLKNLLFVQGTSIILSFDVAQKIIFHKKDINKDIIDDVSIAMFIRDLIPHAYNNITTYKIKYCVNEYIEDSVFIRNKSVTRENYKKEIDIDIENISNVINKIYN
jgi:hypothetical protein